MVCEVSQNPGPSLHRKVGRVGGDFKRQFLTKGNCCITPRQEEFAKIDRHGKLIDRAVNAFGGLDIR